MIEVAALRHKSLTITTVKEPRPAEGQVLVRNLACAVCASDVDFVQNSDFALRRASRMRTGQPLRLDRDVYLGHEFVAEVVTAGPHTDAPPAGTRVLSMPMLMTSEGAESLISSNVYPAGYGEAMLLTASFLVPVPSDIDSRVATLAASEAIALHAVVRSGIRPGETALVVGADAVGLGIVTVLRRRGIELVVVADTSAARAGLGDAMGATTTICGDLAKAMVAWHEIDGRSPLVVFQVASSPGMVSSAIAIVPRGTRIIVVGVASRPDPVDLNIGLAKEVDVRFARSYSQTELATALRWLADGSVDLAPAITAVVPLSQTNDAVTRWATAVEHCAIVVDPTSKQPAPILPR